MMVEVVETNSKVKTTRSPLGSSRLFTVTSQSIIDIMPSPNWANDQCNILWECGAWNWPFRVLKPERWDVRGGTTKRWAASLTLIGCPYTRTPWKFKNKWGVSEQIDIDRPRIIDRPLDQWGELGQGLYWATSARQCCRAKATSPDLRL